jgi:hypothetical protein
VLWRYFVAPSAPSHQFHPAAIAAVGRIEIKPEKSNCTHTVNQKITIAAGRWVNLRALFL